MFYPYSYLFTVSTTLPGGILSPILMTRKLAQFKSVYAVFLTQVDTYVQGSCFLKKSIDYLFMCVSA